MPLEVGSQHTATWSHTAGHDVTLTVTRPDGTTETPDVTSEGQTYSADILLAHPGRWVLRWEDTTAPQVLTDVLNVWPTDPRLLISIQDAAQSLRWRPADLAANEDQLRLYIAAATDVIEDLVGAVLVRTIEQAADGNKTGVALWERATEILEVLVDGKATTAYVLDPNASIVYAKYGDRFAPGRRNVVIRYRTGGESVSPSVQLATKELVRHLWQIGQQAQTGGAPASTGASGDESGRTRTGFAVPRRVIELCSNQYTLPGPRDMNSTSTAAYEFKLALYNAAVELWRESHPEFLVCWGKVGTNVPDKYVEIHGTDSDQEPGPLSASNRSREETIRLETQWWVTVWGQEDAAREADEYLYARIRELEHHIRKVDTTLGGAVRECFLLTHATDDTDINNQDYSVGRLAVALAVFQAKVRITG